MTFVERSAPFFNCCHFESSKFKPNVPGSFGSKYLTNNIHTHLYVIKMWWLFSGTDQW
jgi:hypothetical protein